MLYYTGGVMNYSQYKEAEKNKVKDIHYWANECRKIQKTLEYNPDPKAIVRHHLRDTEEQRKYNDEHYEYFGFNQDGTFEYGKYVIFVTKEEHTAIHRVSDETKEKLSQISKNMSEEARAKISAASRKNWQKQEYIEKMMHRTEHRVYHCLTDETKRKISITQKANMTDEHKKIISEATKEAMKDPAIRQKIVDANTGENNHNYGKPRDDKTRSKISESKKLYMLKLGMLFKEYKTNGGTLKWKQFQTYARDNNLIN